MPGDLCTAPRIISLSSLSLVTDVTDATLGASGLWLGTRRRVGGTAKLTKRFFGPSLWLHGQQDFMFHKPWSYVTSCTEEEEEEEEEE